MPDFKQNTQYVSQGPETFLRGPSGRRFLNFSFQNGANSILYFWAMAGSPKRCGAQGNLPPYPTLSMGLLSHHENILLSTSLTKSNSS